MPAAAELPDPFGHFDARNLLRHGAQVVLANFAVACLTSSMRGGRFWHTLVYAETIGLLIWLLIDLGRLRLRRRRMEGWPAGWRGVALAVGSCVIGYFLGTAIVDAIFGYSTWADWRRTGSFFSDVGWTAAFCSVIIGWFYFRAGARSHSAQLAAVAHEATLARLVLLQSQLEPHMLFNTLANLRALIAADPARAQAMLDRLIDFLRATLDASRAAEHPLGNEFARVDDYLALMKVRMGDRLHTALDLPPELAALPVPPLLLQPLVENAIKHGLEPKRGPGTLRVTATRDGHALVLAVVDSGQGLEAAAADKLRNTHDAGCGSNFGLVQVRERLQTLHGDAARFTLEPGAEGGTRAEIRLPLAATPRPTDRSETRP